MFDSAGQKRPRHGPTFDRRAVFIAPLILAIIIFILITVLPSKVRSDLRLPPNSDILSVADKREAVKDAFRFAWDGYYKIAFPHDELKPATETAGNSRNNWGATAVDALGTAILMEEANTIEIVLEHISNIDYSQTETSISLFESTIRYLGGMLSAYDLLAGPFKHLVRNQTAVDDLLVQSEKLGEILSRAFVPGHVIPHPSLRPNAEGTENSKNSIAGAGTLVLEWTRLSDLRGNNKFANLTQKAEEALLNPMPKEFEPYPGLVGTEVDVTTGQFLDCRGGWGGSEDSFYEYLIKMYVYDKKAFGHYKDRWVLAANSTIEHLASGPEKFPDVTWIARFDGDSIIPLSGHMECFAGGNFLLGGMVLDSQTYKDFGLKLVEDCRHVYKSTLTGIGPETFRWTPRQCSNPNTPTRWNCDETPSSIAKMESFYTGFWISDASYNLRPETIESYYYAYRITHDPKYQDWAWEAFVAINKTARMEHGFNYLGDVMEEGGGKKGDNQESYFFSETLKYLWLIFAESGVWHFNAGFKGNDKWVFNTEGHPLRIRG